MLIGNRHISKRTLLGDVLPVILLILGFGVMIDAGDLLSGALIIWLGVTLSVFYWNE